VDEDLGIFTQTQSSGTEHVAAARGVPRGLGPLSPEEQEALLAEPAAGPLQTSLPLSPVVQESFAEALGIVPPA
jgi:hypothetical protein